MCIVLLGFTFALSEIRVDMDTYKTLAEPSSEVIFKDKGSKFLGYAFPVSSQEEIKILVEGIKKKHHSARHWCYAWQIGAEKTQYRVNDDGEPNGTAGLPIYGQIQSFGVTNVLIVIVRYFGGIKLGVGGLVNAYRTTARMTLEESTVEERLIKRTFRIHFEYKDMNRVMRVVKERNLEIFRQEMQASCSLWIDVRRQEAEAVKEVFRQMHEIEIQEMD